MTHIDEYEDIDDDALDRISEYVDTSSGDYQKIRQQIAKKYPNWSQTQRTKFAMGLVEREAGMREPVTMKQSVIESRTTLAGRGTGAKRQVMIRDSKGRYLGRPKNVKTYVRHGKVFGKNILTGKKRLLG